MPQSVRRDEALPVRVAPRRLPAEGKPPRLPDAPRERRLRERVARMLWVLVHAVKDPAES
jgi:hypothetical protein